MPEFQKGQSGNWAGRPPGLRNRATNLLEDAAEKIAKRAAQRR